MIHHSKIKSTSSRHRVIISSIYVLLCILHISWWGEDNGFYLRVVKTIFYEWVKYFIHHAPEDWKFISSSHRVILFLLYRFNAKSWKWRHRYLHKWGYGKYVNGYFLVKHSHLYNKYYYVCILEFLVLFRAKMALTTYACIAGLVVPVPKALPRIRSNKQELGLTRY